MNNNSDSATKLFITNDLLYILEKNMARMNKDISEQILKKYSMNKTEFIDEFLFVFLNQSATDKSMNESRINNASIIDQTTYETYHFDDYDANKTIIDISISQIEAKGHKACLIYRDTAINRVLEPFKFEGKHEDNNDFHMSFSINTNNINNDDKNRCSLESGKTDQTKIQNLLVDFLRELFDHRIVERIDVDSISESKGKFFITVVIVPVRLHGNTADVTSYIKTFNMFPREIERSQISAKTELQWDVFVATINGLIANGNIQTGEQFTTSDIIGTRYKVKF